MSQYEKMSTFHHSKLVISLAEGCLF